MAILVYANKHNGSLRQNQENHQGGAIVAARVTLLGPSTLGSGTLHYK